MIQLISGILASALHVFTGPDHLAAVTPLAIESRKKSWNVGLFWGIGHVAGMLLIGLLFMLFKEYIPVEAISHHSERIVGIILVAIGLWAIYRVYNKKIPRHKHPHYHNSPEPHVHIHSHPHQHEQSHEHEGEKHHKHQHTHSQVIRQNNIAALGVGTLHGFAGISHLVLMLPTLALPTMADSLLYLSGFAVGTLAAMVSYATTLGFIGQRSKNASSPRIFMNVRLAGGLIAIAVGIYWFWSTF